MGLTGRFNFRRTFTGKIVLQLEEDVKAPWPLSRRRPTRRRWRDANVLDLAKPELRALIDLRMRPSFQPRATPAEADARDEAAELAARALPGVSSPAGEGRISTH
jgi:hypothetical protein